MNEVINQNRMDRADDLVVEDFVELDPLPGQRQGREGLKEGARHDAGGVSGYALGGGGDGGGGDSVVTRFTWTGTHRGVFLGVPATGRSVIVKGVVSDQLVGGKMSRSRVLMDSLGMMQQLGVVPSA